MSATTGTGSTAVVEVVPAGHAHFAQDDPVEQAEPGPVDADEGAGELFLEPVEDEPADGGGAGPGLVEQPGQEQPPGGGEDQATHQPLAPVHVRSVRALAFVSGRTPGMSARPRGGILSKDARRVKR